MTQQQIIKILFHYRFHSVAVNLLLTLLYLIFGSVSSWNFHFEILSSLEHISCGCFSLWYPILFCQLWEIFLHYFFKYPSLCFYFSLWVSNYADFNASICILTISWLYIFFLLLYPFLLPSNKSPQSDLSFSNLFCYSFHILHFCFN
jgi:hypothetical protein